MAISSALLWLGVSNLTALFAGGLELSTYRKTGQARSYVCDMRHKSDPEGLRLGVEYCSCTSCL